VIGDPNSIPGSAITCTCLNLPLTDETRGHQCRGTARIPPASTPIHLRKAAWVENFSRVDASGEPPHGVTPCAVHTSSARTGALASTGVQNLPRTPKAESAIVWKLHSDKTMEPVQVSLGITDHAYTEVGAVLKGELKEGDDVIIRSVTATNQVPVGIRR
jgi:hypothetical protein